MRIVDPDVHRSSKRKPDGGKCWEYDYRFTDRDGQAQSVTVEVPFGRPDVEDLADQAVRDLGHTLEYSPATVGMGLNG